MNATLLESLGETPEPSASCTNCPAVLRLERALEQLPEESLICPICGKPAAMMSDTEDSEVLEIDVRAHRRRIRRRRYRAACDCDPTRRTLVAPPPPKLIPKGNCGVSIWVLGRTCGATSWAWARAGRS